MPHGQSPRFKTTRWSLILAAADRTSADGSAALASLCEIYWFPVYAFIRRTGTSPEDAQDLTQAFFTRVLDKGYFGEARQERGRFRAFLLASVRHFLSNQRDANRALKRGGGRRVLPLEIDDGERRYLLEPIDSETPEHLYERRWALMVIERAMMGLATKHQDADRARTFAALRPLLTEREPSSSAEAAAALGLSDGALRVALHRLRKQFAHCLRDVIRETVDREQDVDDELQHLLAIVAR